MLTVGLRLVEFLDSAPLPDCAVTFSARVVAGWKTRLEVDVSDEAGQPGHPGNPHGSGATGFYIDFDTGNAVDVTARGITGSAGEVNLQLLLNGAFTTVGRQRRLGRPPDAVEAHLAASVEVYGLNLPAAYHFASVVKPSGNLEVVLVADVARSIVGDTADRYTMLWFQLHAAPAADSRFYCVVTAENGAIHRAELSFRADQSLTALATVGDLSPGTEYRYELRVRQADGAEHVLTRGGVRTLDTDPRKLTLAFASCHSPGSSEALGRWQALARRDDVDLAFLIGDQIYGDGIERMFPSLDWRERYERRYNQLWNYQPVRDVMRSRPVYMTLDDHDVIDDWGVVAVDPEREQAGLRAYRIFQQAHNPGGSASPNVDFHFRRGPAAFMVTDSRTARGRDHDYPIMGRAQYDRLKAWAASDEVRTADLVFVIVPVPPAMLPIAELEKLAGLLAPVVGATGGALLGALAGAVVGFIAGGPAGAVAGAAAGAEIGAFVGAVGAKVYYEHKEDTITEPDIRDAWTYDKNLPDLVRLFDVLFDVANDIGPDGRPGPRPRGVFVLSGDYHFGAIHRVRSGRTDGRHDHRNNPVMLQVTSSPISKPAIDADKLLLAASLVTEGGEFKLDGSHYHARFTGHIEQRNFGRMSFERLGTTGRSYRIQVFVEGERDALMDLFDLDLDARPVMMRNLIGELLTTSGRITLIRAHDLGTGFGPATDRIDGEVVIVLDSEPGRAFGLALRNDDNLPSHQRMLAICRDAFAAERPVTIDYLRSGPLNGTIIRVAELPAVRRFPGPRAGLAMENV